MVLYKYIKSHRNDSLICQKKKDKTTIYKSLHRKLKIEQHEKLVWTQMLRNGKQFLFHVWYPSCYSCYKPGDMSWQERSLNDIDNNVCEFDRCYYSDG
jgi:hypothetical protein